MKIKILILAASAACHSWAAPPGCGSCVPASITYTSFFSGYRLPVPTVDEAVATLTASWYATFGHCSSVTYKLNAFQRVSTEAGYGKNASGHITDQSDLVISKGIGCYIDDPSEPINAAQSGTYKVTKYQQAACPADGVAYKLWWPVDAPPYCEGPPRYDPCPVAPLKPLTDPISLEHERGRYKGTPDLQRVDARVVAGQACIIQKVAALGGSAPVSSGYRPAAYQEHLREVWDKWQLLQNNNEERCKAVKAQVEEEWAAHALRFQPGTRSNHNIGMAVDIGGVPPASADAIAAQCNMYRRVPSDPVHYEPR